MSGFLYVSANSPRPRSRRARFPISVNSALRRSLDASFSPGSPSSNRARWGSTSRSRVQGGLPITISNCFSKCSGTRSGSLGAAPRAPGSHVRNEATAPGTTDGPCDRGIGVGWAPGSRRPVRPGGCTRTLGLAPTGDDGPALLPPRAPSIFGLVSRQRHFDSVPEHRLPQERLQCEREPVSGVRVPCGPCAPPLGRCHRLLRAVVCRRSAVGRPGANACMPP